MWKIFMAEDHNHDGALTYKEFQSTLRKFNIEMSAERFNEVVLDFDRDGDRSIPYRELLYSLQGEETKIMLDHLNGTSSFRLVLVVHYALTRQPLPLPPPPLQVLRSIRASCPK